MRDHRRTRRGAWIETLNVGEDGKMYEVAPRRGAWIETTTSAAKPLNTACRTPQGCVD